MTLVEMLVVLAIIGIMSAILVPAVLSSGALTRDRVGYAARELHQMLTSTQVFASTNRVDTALVYSIDFKADSRFTNGVSVLVVDGYGMARRFKPEEIRDLVFHTQPRDAGPSPTVALNPAEEERAFILVGEEEGIIRLMQQGTVLGPYPRLNENAIPEPYGLDASIFDVNNAGQSIRGLRSIRLYETDNGEAWPIPPDRKKPDGTYVSHAYEDVLGYLNSDPYSFPAHVFSPAGYLKGPGIKARYTVKVDFSPDASLSDRFLDEEGQEWHPGADIELYEQTGRIKMADEG